MTGSADILTGPVADDVAAWFAEDYADLTAAYKSLPPEEQAKVRNPARGRADVRLGYLLAIANRRALPLILTDGVTQDPIQPVDAPAIDRACGICASPMRMVTEHRKSGRDVSYAQCTQRRKHPKRETVS